VSLEPQRHGDAFVWRDENGLWVGGQGPSFPAFDEASDAPPRYATFWRTDLLKWYQWNGGAWVEIESNPAFNDDYWEDLRFPAQGINPVGPTAPPTVETDTGMLLFAPNATNLVAGIAQLPHAWHEGTDIRPHVHWNPAAAGAGNVLWRLEYTWVANEGGVFTGTYAHSLDILAAAGGNGVLAISSFGAVSGAGMLISSLFFWRVSRIGGDGSDTFAGDARLCEFDIHYQIDAAGSRQLFVK
jgi:hypothetical protein